MNIDLQKNWWIVNVAAGVVGIIAAELADQFVPGLAPYADILFITLVGLSFLWVFATKGIWWAVAPGVGVLAMAVAGVVNLFVPPNNGWIASVILGLAGFVIAAVPNPRDEMKVVPLGGIWFLVIGFLIAPIGTLWKVILCVASVLLLVYFIWRNRDAFRRLSKP